MSTKKRIDAERIRELRFRLVGSHHGSLGQWATLLNTPYRTAQDWEKVGGPGVVEVAATALEDLVELAEASEAALASLVGLGLAAEGGPPARHLAEVLERIREHFGELVEKGE